MQGVKTPFLFEMLLEPVLEAMKNKPRKTQDEPRKTQEKPD